MHVRAASCLAATCLCVCGVHRALVWFRSRRLRVGEVFAAASNEEVEAELERVKKAKHKEVRSRAAGASAHPHAPLVHAEALPFGAQRVNV